MKKYCINCGKKLIPNGVLNFDEQTGKPILKMICPSNICGHEGVNHEWTNLTFFDLSKCKKCNV